ncbi:MAG: MerR family transcriptional regulator [bacterium]
MYTISEVARRFKISRSTLLYYESIGLLVSSSRTSSNYRLYSEEDIRQMEQISTYRQSGMTLKEIKKLLTSNQKTFVTLLEKQLKSLNKEIQKLRHQQQVIINLLKNNDKLRETRVLNKKMWIALLAAVGLSSDEMQRWHVQFEKMAPEVHQDFLESLGISPQEIRLIRKFSAENGSGKTGEGQ